MTKKEFVLLASRALSLNLVFWSVGSLVYVPGPLLEHFRAHGLSEFLLHV